MILTVCYLLNTKQSEYGNVMSMSRWKGVSMEDQSPLALPWHCPLTPRPSSGGSFLPSVPKSRTRRRHWATGPCNTCSASELSPLPAADVAVAAVSSEESHPCRAFVQTTPNSPLGWSYSVMAGGWSDSSTKGWEFGLLGGATTLWPNLDFIGFFTLLHFSFSLDLDGGGDIQDSNFGSEGPALAALFSSKITRRLFRPLLAGAGGPCNCSLSELPRTARSFFL